MTERADTIPVIWTIGVDCLDGAGIMTDARAAMHYDVHCATMASCITAKNSLLVTALTATPVDLLEAQWLALTEQTLIEQTLIEQKVPQVIKIGLLANVDQVIWLGGKLAELRHCQMQQSESAQVTRVIYDPVLAGTSADFGFNESMLAAIRQYLLPAVDLLTPNLQQAQRLCQVTIDDNQAVSDLVALARTLSIEFELSVLLKSGQLARDHSLSSDSSAGEWVYDCYVAGLHAVEAREPSRGFVMTSPWLANERTFDSNSDSSTFASLIAALLAQDYTMCDALVLARTTINQTAEHAVLLSNTQGSLNNLTVPTQAKHLPKVSDLNCFLAQQDTTEHDDTPFAPTQQQLGLYPVVDTLDWLERLLQLGVKTIQLRAKDFCADEIEPQIIAAIALGRKYQARLFINDYWQLAIEHQAYGVHLGQEDLALADLAQIKAAGLRLGLSTHGLYEAVMANQLQPSYIALGHIYATQTKDMPSTPQGIDKLKIQVELFKSQRPLVAIGGITRARVADVVATGIGSIALVTAITQADDVTQVTESLLAQVGAGQVAVNLIPTQRCEVINE